MRLIFYLFVILSAFVCADLLFIYKMGVSNLDNEFIAEYIEGMDAKCPSEFENDDPWLFGGFEKESIMKNHMGTRMFYKYHFVGGKFIKNECNDVIDKYIEQHCN